MRRDQSTEPVAARTSGIHSIGRASNTAPIDDYLSSSGARQSRENEGEGGEPPGSILRIVSCLMICVIGFNQGALLMWINPVLAQLLNGTDHYDHLPPLNDDQAGSVASFHSIGAMIGAAMSGFILKGLAKTSSGLALLFPFFAALTALSWFLLARVQVWQVVVLGRVLTGFFITSMASLSPKYISIVAPDELRDGLLSGFSIIRNLGMILTALVGVYLPWPTMTLIFGFAPPVIVALSSFFLVPASLKEEDSQDEDDHNDRDDGNGSDDDDDEISARVTIRDNQPLISAPSLDDDTKRRIRNSTLRLIFLGSVYALSGISALTSFTELLIPCHVTTHSDDANTTLSSFSDDVQNHDTGGNNTHPECNSGYTYSYSVATSAFLVCQLVGSFISNFFVSRLGRRCVLVLTNVLLALSTFALSAYYYTLPCSPASPLYCYIPISVLIIFFLCLGCGIGTLYTVFLGDLPKEGQHISLPIIMVWLNLLNFVQGRFFLQLLHWLEGLGLPVIFLFHAIINLIAVLYTSFSRLHIDPPPDDVVERSLEFARIQSMRGSISML